MEIILEEDKRIKNIRVPEEAFNDVDLLQRILDQVGKQIIKTREENIERMKLEIKAMKDVFSS